MKDKNVFVMAGFVIEGELAGGMQVRLPFQANVTMTADISQIQTLHRPDGDVVCLSINCRDDREIALWEALKIQDRTIDIGKAVARA